METFVDEKVSLFNHCCVVLECAVLSPLLHPTLNSQSSFYVQNVKYFSTTISDSGQDCALPLK